jgi:hypothetical protein
MPLLILTLLAEALKLINLILEGVPVEQRRAQSIAWFWLTWPGITKPVLKLAGTSDAELAKIEALMKDTKA